MSTAADVTPGIIWEDGSATLMARITGENAVAVTQASLSSIVLRIFDLSGADPNEQIYDEALTIASVIFDTLQTDARWTADSTGYNFRHTVVASAFADGDHDYRLEYKFTPTSGSPIWKVYQLHAEPLRSDDITPTTATGT